MTAKTESDIFEQIITDFSKQNNFDAFLNASVHFDNRDWTYGQFLYKHCFDEVQKFTYKCKDYFDGKEIANFGEAEKNLAQKVAFIFSNNLARPDGVLQTEKIKELDIFNGDKEKEAFYQNLFANSERSVEGNPCYWHPVSQYQTLVIENELSKIGMSSEQIRDLMVHCEKQREKTERFYKDNMPAWFVHNSKVSPAEMGDTVQTRLRSVDSAITTQKYCFIAEPDSFHSGLPMQGDKEFKSWPRFSPKVMAFQMSATEFADKTQDSYNYQIDMSQRDAIQPCIPLWGGVPSEWVSVKDLSYSSEVEKETLQDLQKQGMKFYLVPDVKDWELLRQAENLSEKDAEIFMQKLCKDGKATLFPNKDEIEEFKQQITQAREETNQRQVELRVKYDFTPPQFVAHATHVSQEEFKLSADKTFAQYPENTDLVPAFSKGTQNEFNAEKSVKSRFDVDKLETLRQFAPEYPERVFAISTKQDDKGNPVLDAQGRPVPQDGSYAYSLKKCCASINMVDGQTPLLIGFEDKYADFESGKKTGHIYVGKGENFKAEYDERGNITEYTSDKEMVVSHHYETTPKDAMEHNVQLVMFDTEENYDRWAAEVRNQRNRFDTFIPSDDIMIKLLQEEITAGHATFINASERGFNPKIEALQTAQEKVSQDAWNIAFDEKTGEFMEVNDKTGEHRALKQEQEFKPEPEKPSKAPEMKFNPTSMEFEYANPRFQELAERRRELNRTKQDILALKERIAKQGLEEIGLEGKMGQTGNSSATNPNEAVTETHKKVAESQIEDLKPFIKNYLDKKRSNS